jgi:ABC-type proline/glycine betaine transport system ATPase subunit
MRAGRIEQVDTPSTLCAAPATAFVAEFVLVRPEGLKVTPSPQGRGLVMTTTFLGSVTRLGVLLDEDVMVYVDQPNSDAPVPVGTAAEVVLTERDMMVSERTSTGVAQVSPVAGEAELSPSEGH